MVKNKIKKYEQLPPELLKIQEEQGVDFRVGDMFFHSRDGEIIRIREIDKQHKEWTVRFDHATNWEATEWSGYGSEDFERFTKHVADGDYRKIDRPLNELMDEANKVISGEISLEVYNQSEFDGAMSEENALMGRNAKQGLITIQKSLEEKRNRADLIHKAVGYEMEKRKAALELVRKNLYGIVEKFMKQVKKIMRVITTIELYLGIEEELFQIQEGEKAPADTPIHLRQMVLYIDEEVGVHEEGGLDFRNIKDFDEWLIKDNNIDIVLPEKKGVVVLNPRRYAKEYNDKWLNTYWNVDNLLNTYILIRNGDCLYRVYTEKLIIQKRLFPLRKEMAELAKKMQQETWEDNKEKIEEDMYRYKKQAILLQGLVDRTEVFHPLPVERLNLFKLEEAGNKVRFIYDAEPALKSDRPLYKDWKNKLNSKIKHGSRVLLTGAAATGGKYGADRIYYYCNEYNYPDSPHEGVYEVEAYTGGISKTWVDEEEYQKLKKEGKIKEDMGMSRGGQHIVKVKIELKEEHLTILYNPKDEVNRVGWEWEPHTRKKNIRYRIFKDDSFVLNYDLIELEDVDYYLKSRIDREGYLSMMPPLKSVRAFLVAEKKKEAFFIQFIVGRNDGKVPISKQKLEERVIEAMNWWKFKNHWKRAVDKDDTLALRMIEKRILSKNYDTFTKH